MLVQFAEEEYQSCSLLERTAMRIAVLVLVALVAMASLLAFVRRESWWIRVLDFPRAQILAVGLLALGLCLSNLSHFNRRPES